MDNPLSYFDAKFGGFIESPNGHIYALMNEDEHVGVLTVDEYGGKGDMVSLTLLYVFEQYRRNGIATCTMEAICEVLDANKLMARGCPDPLSIQSDGISRDSLLKFYQRFGFVEKDGKMLRIPKGKT